MARPQVRVTGDGVRWAVYVDGKLLPVVSARLKLDAGEIPTVLLEVDGIEVELLGELRAAVAAKRPTRFSNPLHDEIAQMLDKGASAAAVAARLIVPRNDVLEVQQQMSQALEETHRVIDERHVAGVAAQPAAPVAAPVVPAGVPASPATIRLWAAAQGIACAPSGAVPNRVLDAFHAAHPDVPRVERSLSWGGAHTSLPGGVSTATVRAWARDHGLDVPDRGALSQRIIDAYDAAHAGGQVAV
jgi:hypothetical protein